MLQFLSMLPMMLHLPPPIRMLWHPIHISVHIHMDTRTVPLCGSFETKATYKINGNCYLIIHAINLCKVFHFNIWTNWTIVFAERRRHTHFIGDVRQNGRKSKWRQQVSDDELVERTEYYSSLVYFDGYYWYWAILIHVFIIYSMNYEHFNLSLSKCFISWLSYICVRSDRISYLA